MGGRSGGTRSGGEPYLAEGLIAQPFRGRNKHCRRAEQRPRIDQPAAFFVAVRAGLDVTRNALAHQDGELSVPARDDGCQFRAPIASGLGLADDKQCAQGLFDGIAKPLNHLLGGVVANAERLREFGTGQAVSVSQIQHFAVAV
jgi:hypothetical protein